MTSKAKILIQGSALRMVDFFANAIIALILMPFIIHSLGDKMYGLWILVGTFLGYYGLMDFGLNSAVQRFVSRAVGVKDQNEINRVINTSLVIFAVIGVIALIITVVVSLFIPVFVKNISEIHIFRMVLLILGINFALGFPMRVFSGILTSHLRYDLSTSIELSKLLVRTVLIVYFLGKGCGVLALAWITLVMDMGGYIAKYFIVRSLYKYIIISRQYITKTKIKPLFGYSIYTFIAQIADQLRSNVDNVVIAVFLGISQITVYSIGFRLTKYFMDFIGSAIGMTMPIFSQYESRGDYDSIREKFIFTTKISGYLSLLIGGILIIFGKSFIERWMGKEYLFSYNIMLVLSIPMIFALMQNPSVQLLYGISKHKFFTIISLIEGIVNLILSIILVKKLGLIGVALGTAIPMIIIKLVVQPVYTCKVVKISIRKYYLDIIVPALFNSFVILFIFGLVFRNIIYLNYLNLLVLSGIIIILFSCIVFIVGFNKLEQDYLKNSVLILRK